MPLLRIRPMLMIGGEAELAVAGARGSNNRLLLLRRYRSALIVARPSRNSMSSPMLVDRFSSHFMSALPVAVSLKPGWIDETLDPPIS